MTRAALYWFSNDLRMHDSEAPKHLVRYFRRQLASNYKEVHNEPDGLQMWCAGNTPHPIVNAHGKTDRQRSMVEASSA